MPTMYEFCVPTCMRMLTNMKGIVEKARAYCDARKIDPSVVLNYRLAPDMFPFVRQVQIVTDQAKGMAARLAGVDVPSFADVESTFDELQMRLDKTIAFLGSLAPAQFAQAETRDIVMKGGGTQFRFKGLAYVTNFAMPNFFFHAATAYDILRHMGADVHKRDFNGPQ